MTVPVDGKPGWIWWHVTNPAGTVLVPADRTTTTTHVINKALRAQGHRPHIEARLADGTWRIPTVLPSWADTRWAYPTHMVDTCTVRHATPDDIDFHHQKPRRVDT